MKYLAVLLIIAGCQKVPDVRPIVAEQPEPRVILRHYRPVGFRIDVRPIDDPEPVIILRAPVPVPAWRIPTIDQLPTAPAPIVVLR